ncbi:MAG: nickel-dependent lactate racemase [Clostridiales Family XIII bacterium]|jgi:nickel-dependent lactate racemase|nr:nickel-dependent lactate racemase [Clostridiales Family XIII bacterium]
MEIKIPYGKETMTFRADDNRVSAVLTPKRRRAEGEHAANMSQTEAETVRQALSAPIAAKPLRESVKGKKRITVISCDHTRPMPSRITMPILLEEIRKGQPDADITILVATGLHRASTREELIEKYGADLVNRETIIVHDCHDERNLRNLGVLPSGADLVLSTHTLDADILIAEGFIEPHFFAGFSGGRKSVLPGVAGYKCVTANHCAEFIAHKNAAAGVMDGNPIHTDMAFAAEKAGLAFILNVLLDDRRCIVDAVAGDAILAHEEGCRRLLNRTSTKAVRAPIVVTSNGGYPLDRNIYQMVKCMSVAEQCCDANGVIIAVGECRDGHGGERFFNDFAHGDDPETLTRQFLRRNRNETATDQWQSQILARILTRQTVIMVTPLQKETVEKMGMRSAETIEEALSVAEELMGDREAKIVVIPEGMGVIVTR